MPPLFSRCRILTCGNAAVGKSTLTNRVFGIEVSKLESNTYGIHDIDLGFESDHHPGIIIHKSQGIHPDTFAKFLRKRSGQRNIEENLHAVWLCIETESLRSVDWALVNVLKEISELSSEIPVFIVGTKKDRFVRDASCSSAADEKELLSKKECDFRKLFETDEKTLPYWSDLEIKFAFVSQNDKESVVKLERMTRESLLNTETSEAMVAAQVVDVDPKINQAVQKLLQIFRTTVSDASHDLGLTLSSASTAPSLAKLLCDVIAHGCFGIPEANVRAVESELLEVVWRDLKPFMTQSLVQDTAIWGGVITMTATTEFGDTPLASLSPLLEAPAAARMMIKCACDLIIFLDKAFRDDGKKVRRMKFKAAAMMYQQNRDDDDEGRSLKSAVHRDINQLFPLSSKLAIQAHQRQTISKYCVGIQEVITKHRFGGERAAAHESITAHENAAAHETSPSNRVGTASHEISAIIRAQTAIHEMPVSNGAETRRAGLDSHEDQEEIRLCEQIRNAKVSG